MGDSELSPWVTGLEVYRMNGVDLGHQGDKNIPRRKKCVSEDELRDNHHGTRVSFGLGVRHMYPNHGFSPSSV